MLDSERVITSMANWLVFLFKQITVRYPFVADSESGHDRLLLTTERSSCAAQSLLQVWKYLVQFVSGLTIPEFLPNCVNVYIYSRFQVKTKIDVNVRPSSMSRLLLQVRRPFVSRNAHM